MKQITFLSLIAGIIFATASCDSKKNAGEASGQDSTRTVSAGKYCNEINGFCISYPSESLFPDEVLDNGNGQVFKSENGMADLRVYLDTRVTPVEGEALNLQPLFDEDTAYKSGYEISYKTFGTTNYTLAGIRSGQIIFYQKTIISNGKVVTAVLRYSADEKPTYDAMIEPIFKSFK
ncbi:hypothetical protein [Viscerimonas tarda]